MNKLLSIKNKILGSDEILIACHVNPDGDCIGSMLALGAGLSSIGKKVSMLSRDGVPRKYKKLPGADKVIKNTKKVFDLAITVDCNSRYILGSSFDAIKKAGYIIEIDHHPYRDSYGDLSFIDEDSASVGEMIHGILKYMGIKITKNIAKNILTSVIVETNSFRLPNVRPTTFTVCSELLALGVDYHDLSEMVYWSRSRNVAVLSGICMANMKFSEKGRLAWSFITRDEILSVKGRDADLDAVANDILAIDGVEISILFRETAGGKLRVSLRSKGGIDVASLALKFNGGGHYDSAGCLLENCPASIEKLLSEAGKILSK